MPIELWELLAVDDFDQPSPYKAPSQVRPVYQEKVSAAEKRAYLELRGWTLPKEPYDWAFTAPNRAGCTKLVEAFKYQVQWDMQIVMRRFGYTPHQKWFTSTPALRRQFYHLMGQGKLRVDSDDQWKLQAVQLPERGGNYSVWCHYCLHFHDHGKGAGHRVAHCGSDHIDGYWLLEPSDKPQTLVDVYAPLYPVIRALRTQPFPQWREGVGA